MIAAESTHQAQSLSSYRGRPMQRRADWDLGRTDFLLDNMQTTTASSLKALEKVENLSDGNGLVGLIRVGLIEITIGGGSPSPDVPSAELGALAAEVHNSGS